jgi:transposase InsO family protein
MTSKRKRYSAEFKARVALEALDRFGKPKIFNTDRGSQFTSPRFTGCVATVPSYGGTP